MSTQGVGTFLINSKFASGSLVFYEKAVGRTATGDVFTVGTGAVKVGNTSQDVDFQFYGTGSISAIIDCGASSFTLVGINMATNAPVVITDATATSSTTTGALIVTGGIATAADITCGDDLFMAATGVINFGAGDITITGGTNTLAIAGASVGVTADGPIAVTVAALTVGDAYSGFRSVVTAAAASNAYGMAAYFDSTITGTTAGHCYGLGSWINTASTPVLSAGHIIVPFEGGVYAGEAQATARIVFGGQHQAILTGVPASMHAWRLNVAAAGGPITALIAGANAGSVGFAAGETAATSAGTIALADIVGTGVVYVQVYSASS